MRLGRFVGVSSTLAPMTAKILDGKKLAESVRADVAKGVAAFSAAHGRPPGLEVVLVGEDPASQVYTRNKQKASTEVGIRGKLHTLPTSTTEAELLALLDRLNNDDTVDGILVQLPLPSQIQEQKVLDAVRADKDVDGFHPINAGLLASGRPGLVPCTPRGSMKLIELAGVKLQGLRAVVVGRSNIVGKPMAQLLLGAHATVTMAHSRTKELDAVCREADVLVVAVGKAELVRGSWVKPGATVIDVGMNRIDLPPSEANDAKKTKLVGDVAFQEASNVAGAITPVPGGVGPMTIACLLENTLIAARKRVGDKS
jgi:methylenetetrahydrofolate dehydrogenase (NADP+) / methenyltetrahydrofolate cyclohydrolase